MRCRSRRPGHDSLQCPGPGCGTSRNRGAVLVLPRQLESACLSRAGVVCSQSGDHPASPTRQRGFDRHRTAGDAQNPTTRGGGGASEARELSAQPRNRNAAPSGAASWYLPAGLTRSRPYARHRLCPGRITSGAARGRAYRTSTSLCVSARDPPIVNLPKYTPAGTWPPPLSRPSHATR